MSSIKTRKHFVIFDMAFSGFWGFMFFVVFCYMCYSWSKSDEMFSFASSNIIGAIFFTFLSIFSWVTNQPTLYTQLVYTRWCTKMCYYWIAPHLKYANRMRQLYADSLAFAQSCTPLDFSLHSTHTKNRESTQLVIILVTAQMRWSYYICMKLAKVSF